MNIVTLVMPLEHYQGLLATCSESSREYAMLKNGFVIRNADGCEQIQIPCDHAGAELIMTFAHRSCPDVLPTMRVLVGSV